MAETPLELQVRLVLEQQCADIFMKVLAPEHQRRARHVSLFCFEYGDKGNVAYKTSLSGNGLADTIERLLASPWASGGQRFINTREAISAIELAEIGKAVDALCPAGVAFALLVGEGENVQYFASGDRPGVTEIFRKLLEAWKADERRALS